MFYLVLAGNDFDFRIKNSGGADNLFHDNPIAFFQFIIGRGGTDVYGLPRVGLKFFKREWTVIESCRKTEPVFHEWLFTGSVTTIHGSYLRECHVWFVYDEQEILREVIQQAEGANAGSPSVEVAGVILDAGAIAEFSNHFHVIFYPFVQSFCLKVFTDGV